jgi:SAM-dependent methyltransferase
MVERYRQREKLSAAVDRDSLWNPAALAMWAERLRAMSSLLAAHGLGPQALAQARILEIGCGAGGNLADLIRLGADPARCAGMDLLPERIELARAALPVAVRLRQGDVAGDDLAALGLGDGPQDRHDLVLLFTVLSSVLDAQVRRRVVERAWQQVAPQGALLVYDFAVNNPRNAAVRSVPVEELFEACPEARVREVRRLTLAPPLARCVCRWHPAAYSWFNALPWLRTHRLVWLGA